MSIKLTISVGPITSDVFLKENAFQELLAFVTKHQDGSPTKPPVAPDKPGGSVTASPAAADTTIEATKSWLKKHTASEVLTRIGWKTNPEKILLLAALHESTGGSEGWRSADMQEMFKQAKETTPKNFPRDIRLAIADTLVGTVTSRTYKVGRVGWNNIAAAIAKVEGK